MIVWTERQLAEYVEARISSALEGADRAHAERERHAKDNHDWEVRRLTARAEDAEKLRDRFRGGYKRALGKLKRYRKELAQARRAMMAAGITGETDEKGKPKVAPAQEIMDEVEGLIPQLDDLSRGAVRSYVERELRKRGAGDKDNILQEVLEGGYQDDDN